MSDKPSATQVQPHEGRSLKALFNLTDANMSRGPTTQALAAVEVHPLANLFPPMGEAEFAALVADIKKNGLLMPIVLLDGKILDGRHRARACTKSGVDPRYEDFSGDNPLSYVISANLRRRHLNESQRALTAAKLASMRLGDNQHTRGSANLPTQPVSQSAAATLLGVSERSLRTAKLVLESGNLELLRRVECGELTISLAAKVAKMPQEQQAKVARLDLRDLRSAVKKVTPADQKIAASAFTRITEDACLWSAEQAPMLRAAKAGIYLPIDWENVAEKIEADGKIPPRDLAGKITVVLRNLVKLDMATVNYRGRTGWCDKINRARSEIRGLLARSPCLWPTVQTVIGKSLGCAKVSALKELCPGKRRAIDLTGLSYSPEQVLENWFPKPPLPSEEPAGVQLDLELAHVSRIISR